MSNFTDKYSFKPKVSNELLQLNTSKPANFFSGKKTGFENSFVSNTLNSTTFGAMLPRQSTMSSEMFKIPNLGGASVKNANVKSIRSPKIRVQSGRVKNDLKTSQQSKMSLIPRPSFIKSKKSLHGSRYAQLNARKELIKKMVFLAECALKENKEVKQSTPVKVLAGLTPKKTPRSGGYFIPPEFKKKVPKLEDIRSPLEDLIKKEMFSYSVKPTPLADEVNIVSPVQPKEKSPNTRFTTVLCQFKQYNMEVSSIHDKLKTLDETFQSKLKNLPDYKVYNEFLFYQSKKEDLYKELKNLEEDLRNFVFTHTNVGGKLETYIKKKQEIFQKEVNLHKDFEQAVESMLKECRINQDEEKQPKDEKPKPETPQLRRSLRLSKIKKTKFEERTPVTKKLKKLDIKSKGIQKSGRVWQS